MASPLAALLAESILLGRNLVGDLRHELQSIATRALIDTPRRDAELAVQQALYIFREVYDLGGDSTRAWEAAAQWPEAHPWIYRKGPVDYVESWVLFQLPDLWDGARKSAPPPWREDY